MLNSLLCVVVECIDCVLTAQQPPVAAHAPYSESSRYFAFCNAR